MQICSDINKKREIMKIIFIGAGMASLVASERLARAGYDVSVFEKDAYENLSYDWHDDVNRDAFEMFGLPLPKEGTYFPKRNWTFVPPAERIEVSLHIPEKELDWSTERRILAQQYVDRAKDVVDFHFSTPVQSLIVENGTVNGIVANGEKFYADLIVDNSGAMSPFRAQLPKSAHVIAEPKSNEIFVAYRAFHKKADGVKDPQNTNKAYLKHLGEEGISWSIIDPAGTVNVLIGRAGELPKETFDRAYKALKASNPIISDEIVRGGRTCIIPIRYPLTHMVADGYAAIGDAAFMTIPMIGSGIENSMKAACILADTIIKSNSVKKEDLWKYEVEYFKLRGGDHVGIDILKRWLLGAAPKDLDWLFEKGVVDDANMAAGATGKLIVLSPKDLVVKVARGWTRLPLLLAMNNMLMRSKKPQKSQSTFPKPTTKRKSQGGKIKSKNLYITSDLSINTKKIVASATIFLL